MKIEKPTAGWQRWVRAFNFSRKGFQAAWKNEAAFREEIIVAIFLIPASFWLGTTSIERILLIGSILLVLIVELLNSAIEAIVDLVSPEFHELAGRAKDIGSAAVLIALMIASLTWFLILF
jgi:diacylglycerol kinase (ATP)